MTNAEAIIAALRDAVSTLTDVVDALEVFFRETPDAEIPEEIRAQLGQLLIAYQSARAAQEDAP